MIDIIIIDDSIPTAERLKKLILRLLNQPCNIVVINTFNEAKAFFQKSELALSFNILFLDIEIGSDNGFDLIPIIKNKNFNLIVTTGHLEYAVSAIRHSAIDFLLKPVVEKELKDALNKSLDTSESEIKIENLISNLSITNPQEKKILLKSNNSLMAFKIKDIIRCQADVNYTLVYLNNNTKVLISKTLKEIDKTLSNEGFFRIHKSHLINLDYFSRYQTDTNEVILKDNSSLPLSLSRKELFINNFLKL